MSIDEVLARALQYGQTLGEHEARVALVPGTALGSRVWIGTDNNDQRVAYLEISTARFSPFAVSRVIEVTPVETSVGDESDLRTAKIICRDSRLNDVFLSLIEDVTTRLGAGDSLSVLLNSVATWRRLLQIADQGMNDEAAAGLYGELRFLEDLVGRRGPHAAEIWQISVYDLHDFIDEGIRVEVKTSSFQNQQSVTVHGLKQLDAQFSGELILAVAEIQRHGDGEFIDQVVDRLLDQNVDIELLSRKLEARGFVRGMSSTAAEAQKFDLQSWRFWQITPESPVISASKLGPITAAAVADVAYSLNLSSLGDGAEDIDWSRFSI